jgi:gliding motility-associated-like protein
MIKRLAFSWAIALVFLTRVTAQTGTEFWLAPPDVTVHHNTPGDEPIYLNVTTGAEPAVVTVSQPANPAFNGGSPIVLTLAPFTSVRHDLTSLKAQLETRPTNSVRNTGLLIQATANITCYYEISNTNNPDIIALKGANGLGHEFYIPLHKHAPFENHQFGNFPDDLAFSSFDIVATEDGTTVMIYSPVAVDGHAALTPFTISLDRGQTYSCANTNMANYWQPATHPSGAVVLANKPVAVSIKDDSNHNPSGSCYDLMADQIVPVNILGTDYIAIKGGLNNNGDESMFIMAVQNNTQVFVGGSATPVATLFAGQYYRHDMDGMAAGSAVHIRATKPVYSMHVTGFGCEQGMAIMPPLNCAGSSTLSFTRSTDEAFFLHLLVRNGAQGSFVVSPATANIPASAFAPVPGTNNEWMAARIEYNLTQVPVGQGFVVTNTNDVFSMAVINGGASSGCRYGFFSEFAGEIVVEPGPAEVICAGDVVELNGQVSGGTTTGIWTSNGSGTFQPSATALNATYVPSIGDIALGTVTLRLTSTGNCTPVYAEKEITIQPLPMPEAGPELQVCANNPQVQLAGSVLNAVGGVWSGGAGSFLPSNSALNATYTPTAAEVNAGELWLYLSTTGNGVCSVVTDSVRIEFTPSPTVNAGADQTLCANNAAVTLNGSFTVATGIVWSGGAGSFDPSTTNINAVYTPTAAEIASGSVVLTLTTTGNGNCLAVSDQVQLNFTPAPTANAGADQTLCANNAEIALNGGVSVATGGVWSGGTGVFTPNNSTLNATYQPTAAELAAGTLTLTLSTTGNGNCLAATDQVTFTFTSAPIVDAGANGAVCSNNAAIPLNGSVIGATGGLWSGGNGTWSPNNTTPNATYTPTADEIASGSVTLTLTSAGHGNCNAVSDQVTYTFTPAPTANAGSDIVVCANNSAAQLNGSFSVATGAVWSGGAGSFDPGPTNMGAVYMPTPGEIASGSVTLTLTTTGNGNCLAATDQVMISFTAAPVVNAGMDQVLCANNATIALNGSVTGATGAAWSGGAGSFLPNNADPNATYQPTSAELAAGTLTLTLTTTGNGNCSAVSDQVTFTFTSAPIVEAGTNGAVCSNNAAIELSGSVIGATGGVWSGGNGTWSPNNTTLNATYHPTAAEIASGNVTLTLTSVGHGNCNAVSDAVTYTFTPAPTVNAGVDVTVCANNPAVALNGSFTVATGAVWSGGAGSFDPGPTNMGAIYTPTPAEITNGSLTLTLTTTGNGSCVAVADQMTITFTAAPTANAGLDGSVCVNNATIALNGSVTGATGGVWSGGAGSFLPNNTALIATYTPTAAELAAGTITLTLTTTGQGNCVAVSDDVTFSFTSAPIVDAGVGGPVCSNNAAIALNGSVVGATGGVWSGGNGTWSPNNTTLNATYHPTAAEIASGSITLTLTSAGNGNCNPVADPVTFTFTPAPTVSAGSDQTLCANTPTVSLNGSFTIATGGVWSGGAGSFDPSTTNMNAVYTPTAAEIASGSVTLTLTTTGNGSCLAVNDQMTVFFTDAPTANAGPDVTVCANNAGVALGGSVMLATGGVWSGGTGTFSPNNSTLNATYTPGAADIAAGMVVLTLTTTGNGNCAPAVDTKVIYYTPAPIVEAGTAGTVCANNNQIQLAGTVNGATGGVWSGGTGTFSPNAITLNALYTPSAAEIAAGSVTLTLTTAGNGDCLAETDQVTFTIIPAPTVNAGADQTLCANNADAVLNATVTGATGVQWSGGSGLYSPGSTAQNITYTPSVIEIANGFALLTVTTTGNGLCNAVSDQVQLNFTPAPVVDAGPDQSVSENNPATTLAGSFSVATGAVWSGGAGSYDPNNTTMNAVYMPTAAEIAAGSVTLTLTTTGNGSCVAVSDQMTITFTDAPTANAGPDQTVCANNPLVQLNGAVTIAAGGIWSGGNGTFSPNNSTLNATYMPSAAEIAAGSVTLTLTTVGNGNSNPVSDQMVITITPAPVVNAGTDITICANQPVAQLAGVVNNAGGGIWSGGAGSFDPSNTNLGATYTPTAGEVASGQVVLTLTSTNNGLCNAVADQVVISIVPAPVVNAGTDLTACSNNATVALSGSVSNAGGGIWSGGAGVFSPSVTALGATYTPTAAELANGSVTLTLTSTGNGTCLPVTDQVMVVYAQSPTVNAGADVTVCANDPTVLLGGMVTVATGGVWSGGGGVFIPDNTTLNATYLPSPAEVALGTATLTLTSTGNGLCNPVSDQMVITIIASPVADAGDDLFVCSNNPQVQLGASVTGAGGGQWSGGAGTFSPSIATLNAIYMPTAAEVANGSVMLTLTTIGNGNCVPVTDQVLITFTDSPTADAGVGAMYCANNAAIQLNGSVTVANGGQWSGAQGTFSPSANVLNPIYTPSAGEIAAGSVTLTLTTTGNNGCVAVSDQVTYTFSPAPTVNAGADVTVCANNPAVQLNGAVTIAAGGIWSGGLGTFSPSNTALDAIYTPTAAEIAAGTVTLTLTTFGNGDCNPENDAVTITIVPAPVVEAGGPYTTCANNASVALSGDVEFANGGIWSGAGTFTPSPANLGATYIPTAAEIAAGSATITLTSTGNGTCLAEADQATIIITPAPVVDAGAAQTLCANNAAIQLAGTVTGATGGTWSGGAGTFSPNANSLGAVYTPSASEIANGSLWLFLTSTGNGGCVATTDSVAFTFTPAPTADAGSDVLVCANDAEVQLNGAVTVAGGGQWSGGAGTFSPSDLALNAIYIPTLGEIAAGSVSLTLTTTGNGNCNAVSDVMTISFDPVPVVNAGPDQQVCANNPTVQLNGFVGNAPGALWTGGAGTYLPGNTAQAVMYQPTPEEIAAGSITFTLSSTGTTTCNAVTDEVVVYFTDAPVVDAGADLAICANNPAVQLSGDVINANGGTWSGGNGTFSPSANVLSPVYQPTAAEIAAGSVALTLTSTGNGNCLAVTDQVLVTFTPAPVVDAGDDMQICMNNPVVELNGSVTVAEGASWSGGLGTFTPDANTLNATYVPSAFELQSGSITLTLTTTGNGNCLAVTDQVLVTFTPAPVVDAGDDILTCSSDLAVQLNGSVAGGSTTGIWSTSGTGIFLPANNVLSPVYMASSLDSLNGVVQVVLTSTNNGNCVAVSDTATITILPNALAHAGEDLTICATEQTVQLQGGITGNATSGTWSTTGAGSFSPSADAMDAVYTLAPGDAALGTLTFTWSVNSCDNATDQMSVTIVPASTVSAGADMVTCANDLSVLINGTVGGASNTGVWTTLGTGTFTNPTNALANIYNASVADSLMQGVDLVLTATNTGVCPAASDTLHIAIRPFGTVYAGPDMTFCANNASVELNGVIEGDAQQVSWTSSGTGSFYPSANVLNPTYVPSVLDTIAGGVTLTIAAVNSCNNATDALTVTLTPAPYVNAGPDQVYCELVNEFTLQGLVSGITTQGLWSTTGAGSIANPGALSTVYTASPLDVANGHIDLVLTSQNNGNCNPVSDMMTIWLTNGITANAGPDQQVCVLSGYAQMQGTIVNGAPSGMWATTGTGTFVPSADVLNAQYHFSEADIANGAVVLTLTATETGTCPTSTDQMTLTFGNSSFAYAGEDQLVCANAPIVQLAANYSGGAMGGVWSTSGSGSFSNSTDPNATYMLSAADIAAGNLQLTFTTVTNGDCAAVSDAMMLTVQPMPTINAGPDMVVCTAAPVQLAAAATNATGGMWSTSGTGSFLDPNQLVTVYYPSAADSLAGSVTLTVVTTGMMPCSAASDQLVITFGGGLTAFAGPDVATCSTSPEIALNGSVEGTSSGVWSTSGTGTFVPSSTALNATYVPGPADFLIGNVNLVLTTTDNQGCPAGVDTLVVTYQLAPTANAGGDLSTCDVNAPVALSGTFTGATGVQWTTTGSGTFQPDAFSPNATYLPSVGDELAGQVMLLMSTTGNGLCPAATDTTVLSFVNPLQPGLEVNGTCVNVNSVFSSTSTSTGSPIIGWQWDFGNGTTGSGPQATTMFTEVGQYAVTLTVFAQNGCSATHVQVVEVMEAPVAGFTTDSLNVWTDQTVVFTDLSEGGTSWWYNFGDGNGSLDREPTHVYTEEGQYMVVQTVTNAAGCTARDTLLITVDRATILPPKLPNAFSPNGDGVNDVFYVRGGPFETIDLKVYNGWGEMIFQTNDPTFGWDGTHKGKPVVSGVYVYTVVATTSEGDEFDRSGKVTLIR